MKEDYNQLAQTLVQVQYTLYHNDAANGPAHMGTKISITKMRPTGLRMDTQKP